MKIQALLQSTYRPDLLPAPRLEREVLLAFVLSVDRAYLHAWPEQEVQAIHQQQFETLLARRIAGEPIAYLVGVKEFWSLPLVVSPDVLIPRPETERLVELALKYGDEKRTGEEKRKGGKGYKKSQPLQVLDLGTGSGAIALALAVERPQWKITGIDKSRAALRIAIQNAKNLALKNVQFYQSDWFSYFTVAKDKQSFALIVANPPYIAPHDRHLTEGDLRYEPKKALIAAQNGLQDLKQIIRYSPHYLEPKGWLLLEHGYQQSAWVRGWMELCGFIAIQTFKDLFGVERVTIGCKS